MADVLEHGRHPCRAIKALVSSQLDCDRLDYLLRDSYSTGTRYGQLDLERILASLTLAPDGDLALHPRGLMAVEHYLVVRHLMYRSVYNHRLNIVCNWLLNRVIAVARRLGPAEVWADPTMALWLWDRDHLDLESYLANDDIRTGYHLIRWREEGPEELADPCRRLLDRRLPRATEVSDLPPSGRIELLAEARRLCEKGGLAPDGCCALQQRQSRGYHPYAGGLRLWDGLRLQALEQRSPLVASLCQTVDMAWLIHPAPVSADAARGPVAVAAGRRRPCGPLGFAPPLPQRLGSRTDPGDRWAAAPPAEAAGAGGCLQRPRGGAVRPRQQDPASRHRGAGWGYLALAAGRAARIAGASGGCGAPAEACSQSEP